MLRPYDLVRAAAAMSRGRRDLIVAQTEQSCRQVVGVEGGTTSPDDVGVIGSPDEVDACDGVPTLRDDHAGREVDLGQMSQFVEVEGVEPARRIRWGREDEHHDPENEHDGGTEDGRSR